MARWRAAALFCAVLVACDGQGPPGEAEPGAAATISWGFEPAVVTIRAGETVIWRNRSPLTHTVTADPERMRDPTDAALPPGMAPINSGSIAPGRSFRHTFAVPGTYRYACLAHAGWGMAGIVIVEPGRAEGNWRLSAAGAP